MRLTVYEKTTFEAELSIKNGATRRTLCAASRQLGTDNYSSSEVDGLHPSLFKNFLRDMTGK